MTDQQNNIKTHLDKPGIDAPKRTEQEQVHFFDRSIERFRQALEAAGEHRRYYQIGGTIIALVFAGEALIPYLTPALQHLEIHKPDKVDGEICIWDSASTGIEMVLPPCDRAQFTERGDFWGFNSKRIRTAFHWSDFSVNLMDLDTNRGFYWVKTTEHLPMWVFAAPLRTLFHWWMEKHQGQLLHAAAVGNARGAVIITGKGGVGKSTTALACLDDGMFYLGDDYLIIGNNPAPTVQSLYSSAKLMPGDMERFPDLAPFVVRQPHEKTYDKSVLFLFPGRREQIVSEMPVVGILTPRIDGSANHHITEISYQKILGAMSFTTISQLPYAGKYTQQFITSLIKTVPCYELTLGPDVASVPDTIKRFLNGEIIPEASPAGDETTRYRPMISVIVPVYNGERFIADAIQTIQNQNYPSLEIIFINDGSTDNSEAVIQSLDLDYRYFKQENQGPAIARNRGIVESTGEYIAFLDVDDLWPDNNLHHLMDEILADEHLLVVHGHAQHTEWNQVSGTYEYLGNPLESFPGFLGAGIYKREAFSKVGMFDPFFAYTGEDADWFKRAAELHIPLKKLGEVTLFVRRHGENMTGGKNLVELNALKVFKRSLDRVRNPFGEKSTTLDVSVIIPVYNGQRYLAEAIASVLNQDIAYKEILVIDDGSTDQTLAIAERFVPLIRILKQENRGAAAARNAGVEAACGEYLAFLDADDLWEPNHTSEMMAVMREHPDCDMVMGNLEQFVSPELPESHTQLLRDELKTMPGYHPGCLLIKKDTFIRVGMLNEELQLAEFVDWFARADQLQLSIRRLLKVVYRRRIHETNQGRTKREHMSDYTSVLRKKIQRNRKNLQDE